MKFGFKIVETEDEDISGDIYFILFRRGIYEGPTISFHQICFWLAWKLKIKIKIVSAFLYRFLCCAVFIFSYKIKKASIRSIF
jgi:hypothetical protein